MLSTCLKVLNHACKTIYIAHKKILLISEQKGSKWGIELVEYHMKGLYLHIIK